MDSESELPSFSPSGSPPLYDAAVKTKKKRKNKKVWEKNNPQKNVLFRYPRLPIHS
jgi:hypothetical protein